MTNKFNKKLSIALCTAFIAASMAAVPVYADFEETENGYVYTLEDGSYATGWKTINKSKYYFDKNGIMKTGWVKFKSGKKYYFRSNGAMATGKLKIKGIIYDFGKDGILKDSTEDSSSKSASTSKKTVTRSELESELNDLLSENEALFEKKNELEDYREEVKYNMDTYYDYYMEYKDEYNAAVEDAKKSSLKNTRLVYSGNGSWTTKQDDYNDDYFVKAWKKNMDTAEKEYNEWKDLYHDYNTKIAEYDRKIQKNKERMNHIKKLLK